MYPEIVEVWKASATAELDFCAAFGFWLQLKRNRANLRYLIQSMFTDKLEIPESVFLQPTEEESDWKQEMESAFSELLGLLSDEHTMSAYELHSSGLVQSLFSCLNVCFTLFSSEHSKQKYLNVTIHLISRMNNLYYVIAVLQNNDEPLSNISKKHAVERINLFKTVFHDPENG